MRNSRMLGFRLLSVVLGTVIVSACGGGGGGGGTIPPSQDGASVAGEMLVGVQPGTFGTPTVEALITSVGTILSEDAKGGFYRIALNSGITQDQAAAQLKSVYVIYIEKNYLAWGYGVPGRAHRPRVREELLGQGAGRAAGRLAGLWHARPRP